MKQLGILLWILLLSTNWGFAQDCHTGDLIFDSQSSVDNFIVNYPNCTIINGNVTIADGADTDNLQGLTNIQTITGNLFVEDNPILNSIAGLNNLTNIGGDLKVFNTELVSITGFSNLELVGGDVKIYRNPLLTNISGFSSITNVTGDFILQENHSLATTPNGSIQTIGGELKVWWNIELLDLNLFNNLNTVSEDLTLLLNIKLTNFNSLSNLTSFSKRLWISGNDALINLNGLENIGPLESMTITDNLSLISLTDFSNIDTLTTLFIRGTALSNLEGLNNLKYISGGFRFAKNPSCNSLAALSNLTTIEGTFEFYKNNILQNFSDLSSLKQIGTLIVSGNYALQNFRGLENIQTLTGNLIVDGNLVLTSLTGLENLTEIGGEFSFNNNHILQNFQGLNNLHTVQGRFEVLDNHSLVNFVGLENLMNIFGTFFEIKRNPALTSAEGLSGIVNISRTVWIEQNGILEDVSALNNFSISSLEFKGKLKVCNNNLLTNLPNYGNLDSLNNVQIANNASLMNLDGLSTIVSVAEKISIIRNDALVNLDDLVNLTDVGDKIELLDNLDLQSIAGLGNILEMPLLRIIGSPLLENLNGLEHVGSFLGLEIVNNQSLENLNALSSVVTIVTDFTVHDNPSLLDLNGLSSLISMFGTLSIENNLLLEGLEGLADIYTLLSGLSIINNPALQVCHVLPVCNYLTGGGDAFISDNHPNCKVEDCADIGRIYFPMFLDANQNGIMEEDIDFFYPPASVIINPGNRIIFSNEVNGGTTFLQNGNYTITYNQAGTPPYGLTTDSLSYSITIDDTNINNDTIYFGLYPTETNSEMKTFIQTDNFRCNTIVPVNAYAQNIGTSIASGTLWLNLDEDIAGYDFVDTPDTLVLPEKIGWHFENLLPGYSVTKQIDIHIPGPPDFELGQHLNFSSTVSFYDTNGSHTSTIFDYEDVVLCAFDPNDKLVSPIFPNNYSLIDQDLIYTVRFQNTGNAEALRVVIRDTLDSNLDPSTFRLVASSHEDVLTTSIVDNQYLVFDFEDINLPDSTSNFEGSQGFIAYRIRNVIGIEEGIAINNTASIYFDFNPPIVTNTTENILLETFDADEDGFELWIDCDDLNANINPEAIEIANNAIDENCDGEAQIIDVDMDGFNSDEDCDDTNATVNPNSSETPYNNLDDDCNPMTLDDDLDEDGFGIADDCDDTNASINPDAIEITNNEIDENCDGEDLVSSNTNIRDKAIQVIPNPTSGNLQFILNNTENAELEIRSITGQFIYNNTISNGENIDIGSQLPGIYLITIRNKDQVWVTRVVKI